jgi:hypothetical protein
MADITDPVAIMTAVKDKIVCYSTLIFYSEPSGPGLKPREFGGSATLVRVGGKTCLLTAAHVWQRRDGFQKIALTDNAGPHIQALSQDLAFAGEPLYRPLHVSDRPDGGWDEWGPDIALIEIPALHARSLTGKTFYDLDKHREERLAVPFDPKSSCFYVVGGLLETVKETGPQPDGSNQMYVELSVLTSSVVGTPQRDGRGYVDLSLSDKVMGDFPVSYEGVSGAGLWRVGQRGPDGHVHWRRGDHKKRDDPDDPIHLEGVAFYYHGPHPTPADERIRCQDKSSFFSLRATSDAAPDPPTE